MEHLFSVALQATVFQCHDTAFTSVRQMWWIEYSQIERIIFKWQIRKITDSIWTDFNVTVRVVLCLWQCSNIAEFDIWIFLVEPKHFCAAAHVYNFLRFQFIHLDHTRTQLRICRTLPLLFPQLTVCMVPSHTVFQL